MDQHRLRICVISLTAAAVLSACGGGGGDNTTPASTPSPSSSSSSSSSSGGFTLSGTISVPETAALDSDTNDVNQVGWAANNTAVTAQTIGTPIQLLGTVNLPNTGPAGKNYSAGDELDVFKTPLVAGQVIEVSFTGDLATNDIDLILVDADTDAVVGMSDSATSTECLRISRSGNYYIVPYAYQGAAIYNLRIGSPGEVNGCGNTASSTELFIAEQLVSQTKNKATKSASGALSAASLSSPQHSNPPKLLTVPSKQALKTMGIAHFANNSAQTSATRTTQSSSDTALQRGIDTLVYAKHLRGTGEYEYVEPNYLAELQANATSSYSPVSPDYFKQSWHYEQINQTAAIDRILGMGALPSTYPVVAVIDSGIVADHPEFQSKILAGYSFVSRSDDINIDSPNDPSTRQQNPSWHGTHVAGTIAAKDNNEQFGRGVAPMAWLMPIRVFSPVVKTTNMYDVIQAMRYASGLSNESEKLPPRKADVINLSLGGQGACPSAYQDAVNQARAQNVIVVAAAGNYAKNQNGLPAAVGNPANCVGVVSVGALDANKKQTNYSNSGAVLSVAAPGGDSAQSTTGNGLPDSIYSTIGAFNSAGTRIPSFGGTDGTSMAAPHVAGVAALMRYVYPALTPSQFDTLLTLGRLTDDIGTVGRDDATGYGLINARKAVDEALALANNTSSAPSGVVVASPASLSFGANTSSATISLKTTANTSEVVTSITSNSAAISVQPTAGVNAVSKLGNYVLTVDRNKLAVGTSYPTLTVTTSLRSFSVQLAVEKFALGVSQNASFGRVVVRINDAVTSTKIAQLSFYAQSGKYTWSIPGIPAGNVTIVAGTNADGDGYFCERGEACGQFPSQGQVIGVGGNVSGLNFTIVPTGTGATTSSSLNPALGGDDDSGIPVGAP